VVEVYDVDVQEVVNVLDAVVDYDDEAVEAVKAVMKIYQSEHVKSFLEIRNHCTSLIYLIRFIFRKKIYYL